MFLRKLLGMLLLLVPVSLLTSILGFDFTNVTLILSLVVVYGVGYVLGLLSFRIYKRFGNWYSYFLLSGILFVVGTIANSFIMTVDNIDLLVVLSVMTYVTYMLIVVITAYFFFIYDTGIKNYKK